MLSGPCKCGEHQLCTKHMKLPSGKTFVCNCVCHPVEVKKKFVEVEDDEEDY